MTHPDTRPATCGPAPADARCRGDRIESRQCVATPAANPDEPGRVIRDCLHRQVHHEHGTRTAYVLDRCRCSPCTAANRVEAQRRRKAIAYGRWTGLVSTEAARQHVQHLRALGLSLKRIATLSGVGYGTVARLVYGDPSRRQPPTARLRHDTQQRLLNVLADVNSIPPGCRVTAAGSRRRVQALVAAGWPLPTLAQRLGRRPGNLRRTHDGEQRNRRKRTSYHEALRRAVRQVTTQPHRGRARQRRARPNRSCPIRLAPAVGMGRHRPRQRRSGHGLWPRE